jgi:hypothetical protein
MSRRRRHDGSLGGRIVGRVADAILHEPPTAVALVTYEFVEP